MLSPAIGLQDACCMPPGLYSNPSVRDVIHETDYIQYINNQLQQTNHWLPKNLNFTTLGETTIVLEKLTLLFVLSFTIRFDYNENVNFFC